MSDFKVLLYNSQNHTGFGLEFNTKAAAQTAAKWWEAKAYHGDSVIIDDRAPSVLLKAQSNLKKAKSAAKKASK
jgi:hypothetical protein